MGFHTFGCYFSFIYFYSRFFLRYYCYFFETNTNYCYFLLSACFIFYSCFDACRGANFIPFTSWIFPVAHPPLAWVLGASCCFVDGYFGRSLGFRGANFMLFPTYELSFDPIVTQALGLKTIFWSAVSVAFLPPSQLVGFWVAAISCSFLSASYILSCWAVFYIGLKFPWSDKFEFINCLAAGIDVDISLLLVFWLNCIVP